MKKKELKAELRKQQDEIFHLTKINDDLKKQLKEEQRLRQALIGKDQEEVNNLKEDLKVEYEQRISKDIKIASLRQVNTALGDQATRTQAQLKASNQLVDNLTRALDQAKEGAGIPLISGPDPKQQALPLPCLDPNKMKGAEDQAGGEDYPSAVEVVCAVCTAPAISNSRYCSRHSAQSPQLFCIHGACEKPRLEKSNYCDEHKPAY